MRHVQQQPGNLSLSLEIKEPFIVLSNKRISFESDFSYDSLLEGPFEIFQT